MALLMKNIEIDSVKMEITFYNKKIVAGEVLEGVIEATSGRVGKTISGIQMILMTSYFEMVNGKEVEKEILLDRIRLSEVFLIRPNQTKRVSFNVSFPSDIPVSFGKNKIWVYVCSTDEIEGKNNKKYIKVYPNPLMEEFIRTMGKLNFKTRKISNLNKLDLKDRFPFVQEFEFIPNGGSYERKVECIKIVFLSKKQKMEVVLNLELYINQRSAFLSDVLNNRNTKIRFTLLYDDLTFIGRKVKEIFNQHL